MEREKLQHETPPGAPSRHHNSEGIEYSYVAYQTLVGDSPHSKWKLSVGERKWRVFLSLEFIIIGKGVSWSLENDSVSVNWCDEDVH